MSPAAPFPALADGSISVIEIERTAHSSIRHRPAPQRTVGDQVVVARPGDGSALALDTTAAVVWGLLSVWCNEEDLTRLFREHYPSVDDLERRGALAEIILLLAEEGLLERSEP